MLYLSKAYSMMPRVSAPAAAASRVPVQSATAAARHQSIAAPALRAFATSSQETQNSNRDLVRINPVKPYNTERFSMNLNAGGAYWVLIAGLAGLGWFTSSINEKSLEDRIEDIKTGPYVYDEYVAIVVRNGTEKQVLSLLECPPSRREWIEKALIPALVKKGDLNLIRNIIPKLGHKELANPIHLERMMPKVCLEVIQAMCESGMMPTNPSTYLMVEALENRRYDVAEYFLSKGMTIGPKVAGTIMAIASNAKEMALIDWAISKRVTFNEEVHRHHPDMIFKYLVESEQFEALHYVLDRGLPLTNVDAWDIAMKSPHRTKLFEMLKYFDCKSADCPNKNGETVLMQAMRQLNLSDVKELRLFSSPWVMFKITNPNDVKNLGFRLNQEVNPKEYADALMKSYKASFEACSIDSKGKAEYLELYQRARKIRKAVARFHPW